MVTLRRTIAGCLVTAIVLVGARSPTRAAALQTAQPVDEIVAQQVQIRADVIGGRRGWDAIPSQQRNALLARQERLLTMLEGKQTIGDLRPNDQVDVANTLEWIKALASNAEDERQVCQRERKTGSNRAETVCRTVGAMRAERERTKDAWKQGESLMRTLPPTGAEL